jgi:hypothetical protein
LKPSLSPLTLSLMKTAVSLSDLTGVYTVSFDAKCSDTFVWDDFVIPSLAEARAFAKRKGGWAEAILRDGRKVDVDSLVVV